MKYQPTINRSEVTVRPTQEPLTLSEAKKHLEIGSDTSHDVQLSQAIAEAREQWEHDTYSVCCYQTLRIKTDCLSDGFELPKRPIHSITTLKYYNSSNVQTTLSTSIYQLDTARRQIRLAYQQVLPVTIGRWDDWEITYKCGYSQDGLLVPAIAKRAMLLLVGHYFENRDMLITDNMSSMKAYDALVLRYMRSSYP